MKEAIGKLDNRFIDITEQTVVNALKICHVDHNKAGIKGALRSALFELLVSISDDTSAMKKYFEYSTVQVATAPKSLARVALPVVRGATAMASIA